MCAVYALGFYIDEEAAQKALGPKFSGTESSSLEKKQSLCDGDLLLTYHLHPLRAVQSSPVRA